ncbi:zinc metalloprotease HtpX [Rhodovarius crocodyli]|uniref:Protease HtpX homolog n=1 Tax=Rhodovarius crocodyli TaxID=1979269 RepID=A0A437M334_9PROT|nr:zinc metalloprotease HtpX [Rhodovarius crocodyli]RVT91965.1 zinc metalloprotease HtpX [Rhodovarius crocodyli]
MGGYFRTFVLLAVMTSLFIAAGAAIGGRSGAMVALVVAAGMNLFAWWGSAGMVLRMHHAEPVTEADAPRLYGMVHQLAQRAGLPMPALYIIHEDQPNAFATGRGPSNAAVAVNSGLVNMMSEEQVAGVVAHELAHIKHRDTLVMSIAATLSGAIGMLAQFGGIFGSSRDRRGSPIAGLLLVIVGPIAAAFVQMAISRAREYEADREGAEICGNPEWLASALERLENYKEGAVNEAAEQNPATAHMFIINPLQNFSMQSMFRTHPATEDRVARLRAMRPTGGVMLDHAAAGPSSTPLPGKGGSPWTNPGGGAGKPRSPWG